METHQILNGKVQLYRRGESRVWQCSASVGGKQRRATTKREGLAGNVQDYRIHRMTSRLEPNQGTIVHRPWFSPAEYKQLYEATRAYARDPFHERDRWNAEQVYDYVLFLANTGLRPDEAKNLQHRDVAIVEDAATGETILEIEVRGKRGVGYCKSMPSAVRPYERLLNRTSSCAIFSNTAPKAGTAPNIMPDIAA